ncbi:MAG: NADH-quinone oxidoreductase subunit E [Deltaproteobacteria bacterium RIFCSPLOWO2_02_56_12]|nr:MAG: NADH-quinone oxidoreductase subunit E [Deltaproteobacteria bacterium RIFCSPLOWO2_02_56_12]HBA40438.1 NADH-quinone oxidoreductase subunit NuoE [Deltaproteobacteria bacterium]
MTLEFSSEAFKKFQETVSRYPKKEAAMIPVLYLAQREFGYLSPEAIEYVAKLMDLSSARVYGVVTFYTMLNMQPVGKYHIQVCRTLPCALVGAEKIAALVKSKLGIQVGETTPDGKFTLSEVECLASCGTGPMMQINDDYYENLTQEKVEEILKSLK